MLPYNWQNQFTDFCKNLDTLSVFIDLSNTFGTVNYSIILKKLEIYSIHGNILNDWKVIKDIIFRKRHVKIEDGNKTDFLSVTCGVPQGLIVGPLLFLVYINDLLNHSKIPDPIMLANDTKYMGIKNYLRSRKQYIQIDDDNKADFLSATWGVPQGSIVEPPSFTKATEVFVTVY